MLKLAQTPPRKLLFASDLSLIDWDLEPFLKSSNSWQPGLDSRERESETIKLADIERCRETGQLEISFHIDFLSGVV